MQQPAQRRKTLSTLTSSQINARRSSVASLGGGRASLGGGKISLGLPSRVGGKSNIENVRRSIGMAGAQPHVRFF